MTYRRRYAAAPRAAAALALMVFDGGSPRALAFQWLAIRRALIDLTESLGPMPNESFEEAIDALVSIGVEGVEIEGSTGSERRRLLSAALTELAAAAGRLSDRLSTRHFSHLDRDILMVST